MPKTLLQVHRSPHVNLSTLIHQSPFAYVYIMMIFIAMFVCCLICHMSCYIDYFLQLIDKMWEEYLIQQITPETHFLQSSCWASLNKSLRVIRVVGNGFASKITPKLAFNNLNFLLRKMITRISIHVIKSKTRKLG